MGKKEKIYVGIDLLDDIKVDTSVIQNRINQIITGVNDLNDDVFLLLLYYRCQIDGLKYDIQFFKSTLWDRIEVDNIDELYEILISWTADWHKKLLIVNTLRKKYENSFNLLLPNVNQLRYLLNVCLETQQLYELSYSWCNYNVSDLEENIKLGEKLKSLEADLRQKISINYDTDVLYHYDYCDIGGLVNSIRTDFASDISSNFFDYFFIRHIEERLQRLYLFIIEFEKILNKIPCLDYLSVVLTRDNSQLIYDLLVLLQENISIPNGWFNQEFYNPDEFIKLIKESKQLQHDYSEKLNYYNQYFREETIKIDFKYDLENEIFEEFYENRMFLEDDLAILIENTQQLSKLGSDLTELLECESQYTIQSILEMIDLLDSTQDISYFEDTWLDKKTFESIKKQSYSLIDKMVDIKSLKDDILLKFEDGIFEYYHPNLNERFNGEFISFLRILKKQYRTDMKVLNQLYKGEEKLSFRQAQEIVSKLSNYDQQLKCLNNEKNSAKPLFSFLEDSLNTNFDLIKRNYEAFEWFMNCCSTNNFELKNLRFLTEDIVSLEQLIYYREQYHTSVNQISQIFNKYPSIFAKIEDHRIENLQQLSDKINAIAAEAMYCTRFINQLLNGEISNITSFASFKSLLFIRDEIRNSIDDFKKKSLLFNSIFDQDYKGLNTDWSKIENKLIWFERIREVTSELSNDFFVHPSLEVLVNSTDKLGLLEEDKKVLESFSEIELEYSTLMLEEEKVYLTVESAKKRLIEKKKTLHLWSQFISYLNLL